MRGLVIAGTGSGVGKTVATLAVIRAFRRAGLAVQPAKAGPDFIDPSHHHAVAGRPSRTLDPWLQGPDGLRRNYARGEGDVCVVEGMMGLYDGSVASTADVAAILDLPVVLVVDAAGGLQSVAATALGFRQFPSTGGVDVDVEVAGIIAQRAAGGRHEAGIREALPAGLSYFGRVPADDALEIPERHLGLEAPTEAPVADEALDRAADGVAHERLLEVAREPSPPPADGSADGPNGPNESSSAGPRIAVAYDEAFRFVYPATLERLRADAAVTTVSPVAGEPLPACDGLYLPGGYPELHAAALEASPTMGAIADRAADGLPVLGECGGLMALAESLRTIEGDRRRMAGVLPVEVSMHERYRALDHVELRATARSPVAAVGSRLRGHEFHYSSAEAATDVRFAFAVERGRGVDGEHDGVIEHRTLGTYAHVHPASGAFDRFLAEAAGR